MSVTRTRLKGNKHPKWKESPVPVGRNTIIKQRKRQERLRLHILEGWEKELPLPQVLPEVSIRAGIYFLRSSAKCEVLKSVEPEEAGVIPQKARRSPP